MTFFEKLLLCGTGEHLPNPNAQPGMYEPRIQPVVEALETLGAEVFFACAGHGRWAYSGNIPWPKVCFLADLPFVQALSSDLFRNTQLHYSWAVLGYFPPSYGFTQAFHLGIHGRAELDLKRIEQDLDWITRYLQTFNAAHNRDSSSKPARVCDMVSGGRDVSEPMPSKHPEQTRLSAS